ncbi:hypothetical protein AMS68_006707 [Peltaster fructicola]|uniref:non-specific serine/threonine protein kinase n=1 Tax=Peltaster fructicola TaxID=286661 RepID=A0A6H0Y3I2_9PEZI|nr:hypothetical protein AMS68_006707 [Peltaster fructicola]
MADRYQRYRRPLAELSIHNNTPAPTQQRPHGKARAVSDPPITALPHNVSLEANGSLAQRSPEATPDNRRVHQIATEADGEMKRYSAVSTTSTTASKRKTYIGHWQLGKTIGKGGCSRVRAVRHRYTQQYGAVKIISRATAENTLAQSLANLIQAAKDMPTTPGIKPIPFGLEREIAMMKLLEHRSIVKLFDVWENRSELYLIMEYFDGGELFHHVEQRRGLRERDICHRDLKPENILLNIDTLEVKLIDFGMAALQTVNVGTLSTPCGSPHYAAPEVISSKKYDGKLADSWSCGVILYVMLTGTTPFNYSPDHNIRALFADICRARYTMPQHLSPEAQDLIRRILVPDPQGRIGLDEVWNHPWMHKYDEQLGLNGPQGSKEAAIGPLPKLEDWNLKRAQDIDRTILRNMRPLWHNDTEGHIISQLLNKEINQEKIFYAALVKHREESLENYIGEYDNMGYSASDYHHSRPPKPPLPAPLEARSQSQYSILNDEHLRPSHSFVEPPPSSISSYDPYRSSRDPVTGRADYTNVVVHRNNSSNRPSTRASIRQNKSLRVEMLRHNKRGIYASSSSLAHSRSSLIRSSFSRNSLATSNWPSSPPVISRRPSDVHKRNVSFNHIRRTSSSASFTPVTPRGRDNSYNRGRSVARTIEFDGSPDMASEQIITSKKAQLVQTPGIRARKTSDTPSHTFRSEIRKHSMELEKACEEAFFRTSVGSETLTPSTQHTAGTETPPSSVSMRGSQTPELNTSKPRPLPTVPGDAPTTFLTRTLKEFRAKLVAYRPDGDNDEAKFGEVMKMIDDLVPAQQRNTRRFMSAPEPRIPDHIGNGLPIISEEESNSDVHSPRFRSFTAPVEGHNQTIRMVPASIAPLSIRKRAREGDQRADAPQPDRLRRQRSHDTADILQAIDENEVLKSAQPAVARKKKSVWFGFGKKTPAVTQPGPPASRRISVLEAETNDLTHDVSVSGTSSEFPIRRPVNKQDNKRGLGKWLGKRGAVKSTEASDIGDLTAHNRSTESLFSSDSPSPSIAQPVSSGKGRSWFARFLNIKPAQKLLCFSIPRSRARQELIILLKEWQAHGIRDLQYSRETQTITARVDRQNSLDIKPVSFRIELFVVLEHGRRVGLCIARFTQTKGAASGFRKTLEVVDGVMRARAWLVENEEKVKALCSVIDG